MAIAAVTVSAADKVITLPKHDLSKVKTTVAQTYNRRQSTREFAGQDLNKQDLSNLLWAANGYNRPETMKRTAPSAMNRQEVTVYAVIKEGIYEYNPKDESLILKAEGDYRNLVAGRQDFVKSAPVSILLSADVSKLGDAKNIHAQYMASVDVGIVTENICLYCAAANLAVVPRASMDTNALKKLLNLDDNQLLIMNTPVGYFVSSKAK